MAGGELLKDYMFYQECIRAKHSWFHYAWSPTDLELKLTTLMTGHLAWTQFGWGIQADIIEGKSKI